MLVFIYSINTAYFNFCNYHFIKVFYLSLVSEKNENIEFIHLQNFIYLFPNCYYFILGSEFDEDEMVSENEDSDDSWTNQEEFNSDLILR